MDATDEIDQIDQKNQRNQRNQPICPARPFILDITVRSMQSINTMLQHLDEWVVAGFLLTLLSFLFCLLYAVMKWNKGFDEKHGDYKAEIQWEREEIELIERLP